MIEPYKSKSITGTKKALGQLQKTLAMIEKDAYCMDVIQQVRAVEGLLKSVSAQVLESHLHTCACQTLAGKNKGKQKKLISELVTAFKASKK